MWIFQFNESGKIIWTDAQIRARTWLPGCSPILDLAADLFIHISRFSRWTEEMMTIDPLQGAVSHQFLTAGEFLIEGDIPEINYSSQAGAKGINCVPIFHVLGCEPSGTPSPIGQAYIQIETENFSGSIFIVDFDKRTRDGFYLFM